MIATMLAGYAIHRSDFDEAIPIARAYIADEIKAVEKSHEDGEAALLDIQQQLENLTRMRYRDLISDAEFRRERSTLEALRTKQQIRSGEAPLAKWLTATEGYFAFLRDLQDTLDERDPTTLREAVARIGSNPRLIGKTIEITPHSWVQPLAEALNRRGVESGALEPTRRAANTTQNDAFASSFIDWSAVVIEVANRIREAVHKGVLP